jgi:hypothetical protein
MERRVLNVLLRLLTVRVMCSWFTITINQIAVPLHELSHAHVQQLRSTLHELLHVS